MSDEEQGVVPMIAYADGAAALDWLAEVFGFRERDRRIDNGRLSHGEMDTGRGRVVMLATPSPNYEGPRRHRTHCAAARRWSETPYIVDGVLVYVDDLAAHYERAVRGGATILSGIESGGPGRRYRVEDLEGHRWMFMQAESAPPTLGSISTQD